MVLENSRSYFTMVLIPQWKSVSELVAKHRWASTGLINVLIKISVDKMNKDIDVKVQPSQKVCGFRYGSWRQ